MQLLTPHLKLREVTLTDLDAIHNLHSLPESDRFNTIGIPDNIETTRQLVMQWICAQDELPRKKYVFCMETNEGVFIGLLGLTMGKPAYKNAEIWYKLMPAYWNKGYATEAVKRIFDFGFSELNLHRIEAGCAVENSASIRVLEKAGMSREGHCRKLLPVRGEWLDNFEFAILESDFFGEKS